VESLKGGEWKKGRKKAGNKLETRRKVNTGKGEGKSDKIPIRKKR